MGYKKVPYTRYAYKLDPNGDYTTLYGQKCKLVKRYSKEDQENGLIFESDIYPEMRYLVDNYLNVDDPSDSHILFNFDIEVSTEGSLPDVYKAQNEITSIAHYDEILNEYTVHLLDPKQQISNFKMEQRGVPVNINSHTTEESLLNSFLIDYETINPTILSGWNSDAFDIPYLYNRLKRIFGENVAKRLSPIGNVHYNGHQQRYYIAGVSCLDMMKLYKNFTSGERSSYSLDAISTLEVGEGKIKYDGTLDKLYETDKDKFIEYNVHDVRLVKMINDKMKLISLANGICCKCHVPLEDIYFSSRFLDGAILTYLKRKGNIVVPNKPPKDTSKSFSDTEVGFSGAYVKEPIPGLFEWIIDLDFTSLYPSLIRTMNISPETKIAKVKNWAEIKEKYSINM